MFTSAGKVVKSSWFAPAQQETRPKCVTFFRSLLYVSPCVSSLRPLDVEFMRRLSKVVNIVPVIAKADTLTLDERDFFKKKVRLLVVVFLPAVTQY